MRSIGVAGLTAMILSASLAHATTLSDLLEHDVFGFERAGPALAATVSNAASTYPVGSASSSVFYVYDPTSATFERRSGLARPAVGELAETIGRGNFDATASYSYVKLSSINGTSLSDLQGFLAIGAGFDESIPVRLVADLDLRAHVVNSSFTYGVTSELDLNITVPVVRTELDVAAGAPPGGIRRVSGSAEGVGDVLLRGKYLLVRERPVDVAAALTLSVPTGNDADFQGTGDTRVRPLLVLSGMLADRFEPLLNAGVDIVAEDVARSAVIWAAGGTGKIVGPLTGSLVFLGRHELEAQGSRDSSFFFELRRSDIIDVSVGLRCRFVDRGFVGASVALPLNDDGLRADAIPTVEVEYTF